MVKLSHMAQVNRNHQRLSKEYLLLGINLKSTHAFASHPTQGPFVGDPQRIAPARGVWQRDLWSGQREGPQRPIKEKAEKVVGALSSP